MRLALQHVIIGQMMEVQPEKTSRMNIKHDSFGVFLLLRSALRMVKSKIKQ